MQGIFSEKRISRLALKGGFSFSSKASREHNMRANSATCPFCSEDFISQAIDSCEGLLVVADKYPVTKGHLLIVPKGHYQHFFTMPESLRSVAFKLLDKHQKLLCKTDLSIAGFNVGMNCGRAAGQTVDHAHIHLIPRRDGDVSDPKGGVRGCIPEKMKY